MAPSKKIAKSGAERMKTFIQKKIGDGTYKSYLEKQKEIMAKKRKDVHSANMELDSKEKDNIIGIQREKERTRKAKYRAKQKHKLVTIPDVSPSSSAYKSSAAKGKAITRAKQNLPCSPRKRTAVVKALAFEFKVKPFKSSKLRKNKLQTVQEAEHLVVEFYQRDDVSRQAPGKNDVISVRLPDGTKTHKQKRHLVMSVMEAYNLWKTENPLVKIGKSKFADLRPKFVLLTSQLPRNVCVCKYHANFILLLESLHRFNHDIPLYNEHFTSSIVCVEPNEDCWNNHCHLCKDGKRFKEVFPVPEAANNSSNESAFSDSDGPNVNIERQKRVKWWQWESQKDEDGKETVEKISKRGLPIDLYDCLVNMIPSFLQHHHIKRCQSTAYNQLKQKVKDDNTIAMLQMDFAENYSTLWQDEIQSAHWKKKQITLLTSCFWNGTETKSCVIVSDDLSHTKNSVITFLDSLILRFINPTVKTLHIWTDGPSSQFKNKFIAAILPWLAQKHLIDIEWHYFATSHGKGCVDGIGGTVKRQVAEKVKQRRAIVKNACTFFECTQLLDTVTQFEYIDTTQISNFVMGEIINIFDSAVDVKGIKSIHHMQVFYGNVISRKAVTRPHSLYVLNTGDEVSSSKVSDSHSSAGNEIKVNSFVKIISGSYKGYYAVVLNKSYGNEWEICYFRKSFSAYVLSDKDLDSREPQELQPVKIKSIDSRNRHTFMI